MRAFALLLPLILSFKLYAINTVSDGYRVVNGTDVDIDAHSNCQNVANASGVDHFVSTRTSGEWSNFLANLPSGVTTGACSTCPTGFILVPGNGGLGTSDFCVMQFEAKNVSGTPASQASGTPWVNITPPNAYSECGTMSESGFSGTFTLISNPEWMTIARNIEGVASNWSGGSVGSGQIPRGHTDNSPTNMLNVSSTSNPYSGTGNNSGQSVGSGWEQKRTHTLSNGNVIWDFAGNAWEWVDWTTSGSFTTGPTNATLSWMEPTTLSGSVGSNDLQSSGGYDSTDSFGQWIGGTGGAARRGGGFNNTTQGGILTLSLFYQTSQTVADGSFRCVYRP